MKKYLSVLALDVRSSVYKIFLIVGAMAAVQLADFYFVITGMMTEATQRAAEMATAGNDWYTQEKLPFTMEQALEESHIQIIFAVALAGVFAVLMWSAGERGRAKTKNFLWRLRIGRKQVLAVWSIYHVLCFLAVIAVQISVVVGMHTMYQETVAAGRAPQALFLAFYRDSFLHGLLPLSDWFRVVRLLCFVITWGLATVYLGYRGFGTGSGVRLGLHFYVSILMGVIAAVGVELFWLELVTVGAGIICSGVIAASVLGVFGEEYDEMET